MKNKDLEKRISEAFRHAAPDVFDRILDSVNELPPAEDPASRNVSECSSARSGSKMVSMKEKSGSDHKEDAYPSNKKKRKNIGGIAAVITAAAAAAAISLGIAAHTASTAVASTISLDSGTGIEITVNRDRRVIEVIPGSEEAARIVDDMDFTGTDLDVTINALLGSMISKGYLSEMSDTILIGVDNADSREAEKLQDMLVEKIDAILQNDTYNFSVIGQTVKENATLKGAAEKYGVTMSKAQLIDNVTKDNPQLQFYDLTGLTISELNRLTKNGTDGPGQTDGADYISSDKALETVLEFTKHNKNDINSYNTSMDYDDGRFIYVINFESGGKRYEYDVDASTGTILEGDYKQ